jgi:hypothetical protein
MNIENIKTLVEKYPKIFCLTKKAGPGPHYPITLFSIECGDGWFDILDSACDLIQRHVDDKRRHRALSLRYNRAIQRAARGDTAGLIHYYTAGDKFTEWAQKQVSETMLCKRFTQRPVPEICHQVVAMQIKEKFGGLRFYTNAKDEYVSGVLAMAESMSYSVCEQCGAAGRMRGTGWLYTACDDHTRPDDLG